MASVSGTSSLGNTSLRGYGGFASGIDRDSVIEQMTAGTTAKITKQQNAMTSLSWKQEAYQTVSDKMLALQDDYFSFAAGSNFKYPDMFAKNQITSMGDPDVTKFVSATGTSDMVDYLSILGVKQLASSATRLSGKKGSGEISSKITKSSLTDSSYNKVSQLRGRTLKFGTYSTSDGFKNTSEMTFPSEYTKKVTVNGEEKTETISIDYTGDPKQLVDQLNDMMKEKGFRIGKLGDETVGIEFEYTLDDPNDPDSPGKIGIKAYTYSGQNKTDVTNTCGLLIRNTSTALDALGLDASTVSDSGISLSGFNSATKEDFSKSYISTQNMVQYLTGKTLTVTYGGQTKKVDLLKDGDVVGDNLQKMVDILQIRFNKAFGSGKIRVDKIAENGDYHIAFNVVDPSQTLNITTDDAVLRKNIGIEKNASTNLSADSSLKSNQSKLGLSNDELSALESNGLEINGVKVTGITKDTTINQLIDKINSTKDIGVKASYMSAENQFVLVATESGSGRKIELDGVADKLFGVGADGSGGMNHDGKDALIKVSYGNGVNTMITSSTNTFNLEGLNVTVNSVFGYKDEVDSAGNPVYEKDEHGVPVYEEDEDGNPVKDANGNKVQVRAQVLDSSQAVSFSAKADVDGVTEKVKKFVEAYNEMIKEINTQITTKPNKAYGPLTEEQKEEMSDKSIENWEKKAKQGLLYNDSTMRELSMSMQTVVTQLMNSGVDYKDLEEMGISFSEDYLDGGIINFDEAKFKAAMTNDPEEVSNVFAGGGTVKKGLAKIIEDTMTPYATKYASRNGNSYGRLIEEAGSEKIPLSVMNNQIYNQLKEMQKGLDTLKERLQTEQDRYISQFTTMETMLNQLNSQSSYLAQFQA